VVEPGAEGVGFFADASGQCPVLRCAGLGGLQGLPQARDQGEALGLVRLEAGYQARPVSMRNP
jgi:hypothetical protein